MQSTRSRAAETTTAAETAPDQSGGPGDGEPLPNAGGDQVATIVVKGAEPVGGVQDLTFTEGEDIRFKVESDVADEIHLHGYDVAMEVEAGGSVEFDVPATLTGVFEVELEQRVVPIAEITVDPA